jgi:hypothetical protein
VPVGVSFFGALYFNGLAELAYYSTMTVLVHSANIQEIVPSIGNSLWMRCGDAAGWQQSQAGA